MIQLHLEVIKKYYFRGYVYREELPENVQGMYNGDTVDAEGEFSVIWKNGEPTAEITGDILVYQYKNVMGQRSLIGSNLNQSQIDYSKIQAFIEDSFTFLACLDDQTPL